MATRAKHGRSASEMMLRETFASRSHPRLSRATSLGSIETTRGSPQSQDAHQAVVGTEQDVSIQAVPHHTNPGPSTAGTGKHNKTRKALGPRGEVQREPAGSPTPRDGRYDIRGSRGAPSQKGGNHTPITGVCLNLENEGDGDWGGRDFEPIPGLLVPLHR